MRAADSPVGGRRREASQDANNLQEDSFDQHGERRWTGFWLGNR